MFVIHFWGKNRSDNNNFARTTRKTTWKTARDYGRVGSKPTLSVTEWKRLETTNIRYTLRARQPEYAKSIVLTFVVRNTSALSGLPLCHSWVVTGVLAMKKWSLVYPGPKSKMYFLPMVVTANIPFWIDLIFRLLSWNQVDVLQFLIFNDVLEVDDQANLRNILVQWHLVLMTKQ